MKKKIILILILSSSIFGIFGCLRCGEHFSFQEINDVTAFLYSTNYDKIELKTDLDSLILNVEIEPNFIAECYNIPLINRSYGWSCDENGGLGVKDRIVDIKYFSSVDYLGIPSGSEIELRNSLEFSEIELIEFLNEYLTNIQLYLDKKQIGQFDLNILFELESGKIQEFELVSFEWE